MIRARARPNPATTSPQEPIDSSPVSILLVDPGGERGGAEQVLEKIALAANSRDFRPILVCLGSGSWPVRMAEQGIESHIVTKGRLRRADRTIRVVVELVRLIRSRGVAIVHANGSSALLYASIAAKLCRTQLIWHIYDPQSSVGRRRRILLAVLQRARPDFVVFANEACSTSWLGVLGRPIPRNATLFPGVEVVELAGGSVERARRLLNLSAECAVVSMFARLEPHKGHEDLIRAAALVRQENPSVRFVLCTGWASSPAELAPLLELRDRLRLSDTVLIPGGVSPQLKADILAATSVLAHPATIESFGLAILEAMVFGKPVVAADSEGARFLLDGGRCGVLVPPGDPRALGVALSALLREPERQAALGLASRIRAARFSNDEMIEAILEIWRTLAHEHRPA